MARSEGDCAGFKEDAERADTSAVDRRLADKHLAEVKRRRTDRYLDHGLVELFQLLADAQERLSRCRRIESNDRRDFERLLADLDEVRDEIEARGICPYHQAALSVCCYS
ncbi:MAG TPA: hypothetical protein VG032_01105 [Acidimicrobiales bacterium]|nr:hypothetical protein [Acidimicrobiales bacterium]